MSSSLSPNDAPVLSGFATALVVAASTMLFVGLFGGFVVLRGAAPEWPPADAPALPRTFFFATAVIVSSSVSLIRASSERRRGRIASATRWLCATSGLGALFLLLQILGGVQFAQAGALSRTDNWGGGVYIMAGLHAIHVVGGLTWLMLECRRLDRSLSFGPACAFWHFVGVLWVAVLLFFTS